MCLILIALESHPAYKLIIAGNRDEYLDRSTAPAAFWKDAPDLLAGRDLRAGGTWFGMTRSGRLAGLTNYRSPDLLKDNAPSRGNLVRLFLQGIETPDTYLQNLIHRADQYNGFNLILGLKDALFWFSNRGGGSFQRLSAGVYGVSNHLLNTPWPKVLWGIGAMKAVLSKYENPAPEAFLALLRDRTIASDASLPRTGVDLEWERILSPIFIASPTYGTRSSTVLMIDRNDRVRFIERSFDSEYKDAGTVHYEFRLSQ